MALFEGKTTAERNKTIAALVLPLLALVLLLRMFFGGDSRTPTTNRNANRNTNQSTATADGNGTDAAGDESLSMPGELPPIIHAGGVNVPEAARNIFAFPAVPVRATPAATEVPTPTPTPPPPLTVNSVSPANVYARTADFTLEVSGDKFTPESRVYVEGQELQTVFKSAQQLSAQVPSAVINAQGARTVEVKTPDGQLYSNTATFNVMPAPTPQVTFIGLFGSRGYSRDRAVLKPNQSSEVFTVGRGELVSNRFKVVNISERAVEFLDTQLNIKHTVPFTEAKTTGVPSGPGPRSTPPPRQSDDDDDEP